jgi:hypothetical protein
MKEARKHITAALLFALATVGSATLCAGIVLVVSDNEAIASLVFFGAVAVELLTAARWLRKRTRQKREKSSSSETHMNVHGFITHMKMHPELMPVGMTEFDLENFRKAFSGKSQEDLNTWGEWAKQLLHQTWKMNP